MNINYRMLREKEAARLYNKSLVQVATETYMKALPLDLNAQEVPEMVNFASNVFNSVQLPKLLDSAIESCNRDVNASIHASYFLRNMKEVLESTAESVAKNNVTSENAEDIVSNVYEYNDADLKRLVDARKGLSIDQISEVVKKNVIKTISDEKAAHEKAESMREEIKEAINDDSDVAVESFMCRNLEKNDPHYHVSFFSKMQDVCMEAFNTYAEETDNEIPYQCLTDVILESTVITDLSKQDRFDMDSALTYLSTVSINGVVANTATSLEKAFIGAVCATTIFEVLKTLRLYKPTANTVSEFLLSNPVFNNAQRQAVQAVINQLEGVHDELSRLVNGSAGNRADVAKILADMNTVRITVNDINNAINTPESMSAVTLVQRIYETAEKYMNRVAESGVDIDSLGYYDRRTFEDNALEIRRRVEVAERNNTVTTITFRIRPNVSSAGKSEYIDIIGTDNNGARVNISTAKIAMVPAFGPTLESIVKATLRFSNPCTRSYKAVYSDTGKPVPGFFV